MTNNMSKPKGKEKVPNKKEESKQQESSFLRLAEKLYIPSFTRKKKGAVKENNNTGKMTRDNFFNVLERVTKPVEPQSDKRERQGIN